MRTYEDLVAEAVSAPLDGRDLTFLDGRMIEAEPPWSYPDRASELATEAEGPVLDMSVSADELSETDAGRYAVILNRHDPYHAGDVHRALRDGGIFLSEQVGGIDGLAINEALGAPLPSGSSDWALSTARAELEAAGLKVRSGRTAFPERLFHDVGALIYFLRAVPRQVPDFSVETYDKQLRLLHDQMSAEEPFRDRAVRFLVEAVRH